MTSAAATGGESAGVTGEGKSKRCWRSERRRYCKGGTGTTRGGEHQC